MHVDSTHGARIAVHDLGGEGPPLLIAHATGFCGRAYTPLAALLARHHHVWALDVRGHGESTPPADGDFAWTGMADDVAVAAAAVAATDPGAPLHAVGHSMGGAALLLAESRAPGTFATAYLYEPIVPPGPWPDDVVLENPLAEAARRRREVFPGRADALWRYASRPPLGALQAASLAAYIEHGFADLDDGTVRLRCRAADEAATFEGSTTGIHAGRVGSVAVPTVVAFGDLDPDPPAHFAPPLAAALPNGELERHEHLGHFGPLQDPVTIAERILLRTADAAPAGA